MGNYTELYHHFVWATKRREPYITPEVERDLHDFLRHKCRVLRVKVHAVSRMPDHVHLACSLPTPLAVADCMEAIKCASACAINQQARQVNDLRTCLYWQPGFGALNAGRGHPAAHRAPCGQPEAPPRRRPPLAPLGALRRRPHRLFSPAGVHSE